MSLILNGDTGVSMVQSGVVEDGDLVNAPYKMVLGTAVASTSGTSIDFTGIPSWAKRITVMFNGVSLSGTSTPQIQLGDSGGIENTGYIARTSWLQTAGGITTLISTTGIPINGFGGATETYYSVIELRTFDSLTWIGNVSSTSTASTGNATGTGIKTLSSTLDRVRITTVNGTDTFDAGTINIMYEG